MNRTLFSLSLLLSPMIRAAQEAPKKICLPIYVEVLPEQRPNMQVSSWPFKVEANLEDSMSPVLEGLRQEIETRGKRKVNCTCGKCTETIIACAIAKSPTKLKLFRELTWVKTEGESSAKKVFVKDFYNAQFPPRLRAKQESEDQKSKNC